MTHRFTGRHMLGVLVLFFGIVIAVNVYMATRAVDHFGGLVVKNSYVASQNYNDWIAASRRQDALGWTSHAGLGADGHVLVGLEGADSATVEAVARHRLREALDQPLTLIQTAPGQWRSAERLPEGRWQVHLRVSADGDEARFIHPILVG
ncbi:FixH family protein [Sphingomicrobium nitratireducens]|uniref:FixH family protein n=1 Tax=Sphingomicrobium nitratireducens TaxID=2964666 RepID=UPI00223ED4E6|nr:FixH family protein [Sphingomicrobium nitratireducens]